MDTDKPETPMSILGPIVESIAWYTWGELPPTETELPLIKAATTTALLIPPGTTEVGTDVHDCVVWVEDTVTLWKAEPVPEFLDL